MNEAAAALRRATDRGEEAWSEDPFTVLDGNQCQPEYPPTECDPATTEPVVDPETGIVYCVAIAVGDGGCTMPIPCPVPSTANQQTICGQLYDFETGAKFAATGAIGVTCPPTAASGPCELAIGAYDALAFAANPDTAMPLPVSSLYIDDCGRFRLLDIDISGVSSELVVRVDDGNTTLAGATGVTVPVAIATAVRGGGVTKDIEHFVAPMALLAKWESDGGPTLSTGISAAIFRAHKLGIGDQFETQLGVRLVTSSANELFYLAPTRGTIDLNAVATSMNGTALIAGTSAPYSGGHYRHDELPMAVVQRRREPEPSVRRHLAQDRRRRKDV